MRPPARGGPGSPADLRPAGPWQDHAGQHSGQRDGGQHQDYLGPRAGEGGGSRRAAHQPRTERCEIGRAHV